MIRKAKEAASEIKCKPDIMMVTILTGPKWYWSTRYGD